MILLAGAQVAPGTVLQVISIFPEAAKISNSALLFFAGLLNMRAQLFVLNANMVNKPIY